MNINIMDNKVSPVKVRILEKDYMVACPQGEQESLIKSAKRVDNEMRRIRDGGKVMGADRIAVIVALNLAHELLNLQKSIHLAKDDESLHQQLQQLQEKMERAVERYETLLNKASSE